MHLVILMVNMLMSRFFGFRHRETEEFEEVYRPLDIGAGLGLALLFALLFSTLLTTIARVLTLPAWLGSITTALSVAASIFLATTWMPFVEHLSLAAPGEMTARGRKATVLLARAIPYLYGLVAVGAAALMATMVLFMISLVLVALATLFGFDSKVLSWQTWAWIGGSAGLVLLLAIGRTIIMSARLSDDWGLPVWRAFVEPGQKHPAGARFFNPLDATLGRLVLILTVPTAKMRTAAAEMPEKRRISDYRRFDGDIIDLVVSICVAMLVFGLVSAVGTAIISWIAPEALSHLTTFRPATSSADGTSAKMSTTDMAMLFGMILVVLPTMLGCVYFLRRVAGYSADGEWAQQRWVRWLARLLEVVRIVSCGLIALVFGGFLALLLDSAAHLGRVGDAVALGAPDTHIVSVPVEGLVHPLLEYHRIRVGVDADLEIEPLVDIKVAVQRLDAGVHRVAALIQKRERWAGLVVSGEYLRQPLLELLANDIALLAQDLVFIISAEADDVVELLELRLDVCHVETPP